MAVDLKTYDPAQVQVSIGGAIITGYEPGTFISVARSVNNFDYSVGPDGNEGIRAKRNDRSALLTLTLRQTAAAMALLSNLANRDEVSSDGVVPVEVTEIGTENRITGGKGWIEKPPDVNYAETPQGRAWRIRIAEAPFELAGSPSVEALQGTLT
jgi:hypothetical protein